MKTIFEAIIQRGGYDLNALLPRIDAYHAEGRLTDSDRTDLYRQARRGSPSAGLNMETEIGKLWDAIRSLQAHHAQPSQQPDIPDYRQPTGAHDAYYAGAKIRYDGKVYQCIAPSGVACVWSPAIMPDYWTEA